MTSLHSYLSTAARCGKDIAMPFDKAKFEEIGTTLEAAEDRLRSARTTARDADAAATAAHADLQSAQAADHDARTALKDFVAALPPDAGDDEAPPVGTATTPAGGADAGPSAAATV